MDIKQEVKSKLDSLEDNHLLNRINGLINEYNQENSYKKLLLEDYAILYKLKYFHKHDCLFENYRFYWRDNLIIFINEDCIEKYDDNTEDLSTQDITKIHVLLSDYDSFLKYMDSKYNLHVNKNDCLLSKINQLKSSNVELQIAIDDNLYDINLLHSYINNYQNK